MLSLKLYILVQSSVIYGFLFDHTTLKPGTSNQCLTLSQYYDEKQEQQHVNEELRHQTEKLRHDTDNTFAVMTSQLEQKLSTLSNRSITGQYTTHNYTVLLKILETMTAKSLAQEKEVLSLKNKTVDLEATIILLKSEANVNAKKIEELQKLQNIQPLNEIQVLQQQMKTLTSITDSLSEKERARRQDVLTLYNRSIAMEQQIKNATRQVSLTSCVPGGWSFYAADETIHFTDIVTEIGIDDLNTVKSNGKFTCSNSGLYLISIHIVSDTDAAEYVALKNGTVMSHFVVAQHTGNDWNHSSSGLVVLLLQTNDVIWVQPSVSMRIYGNRYSCLTIVKLK